MTSKVEKMALPVGVTLDRFIKKNQGSFQFASGELSQLLRDIALAGKIINREVNKAGLVDITGALGTSNVQGENQQKLDVIADIRFIRALKNGGEVCAIITEEEDEIIYTGNDDAKYVVAIDPLDGSSNIDVNVSIGTIFSIYTRVTPRGTRATKEDFLQGGRKQVAAGYILYGSSTILVYTTGHGVNGFTYENSLGEFFLSHPNIKSPEDGKIYSVNEGNFDDFYDYTQRYIMSCRKKRMSGRYIGSLIADFHRNMLKGGIYLYPPTPSHPQGKLRLLYECYPMAFLAEQAGAKAIDCESDILDVTPISFHQRNSIYVGAPKMIQELELFFKERAKYIIKEARFEKIED
ncbi:class 1 fructose-bisphosphatase [Dyadobacter tibetensis]|uniref:class 1 fructose-bisphosphatase n=1 Tax=Dyadobacter tibetensis TaxID=1211851 RepID=UPI000472F446|nr:class 1 fructose-bisphosphatase [Dyadobacter tibetensis]